MGTADREVASGRIDAVEPIARSVWLHRWAILVAVTTFPLIWLGGLVTTQDAGMAVPDWPNTRGYNMFAYPLSTWLYGPFDLLIEHGHRLLGSLVGLLSIGLCVIAWQGEERRWVRGLCGLLLTSVILQGILGGARVLLDARTLAMIHGCAGPLVFALATSIVVVTSRSWTTEAASAASRRGFRWLALGLSLATIVQLVLGAQLRHVQPWAKPSAFVGMVHLHLTFAAVVVGLVAAVAIASRRRANRRLPSVAWLMLTLILLSAIQVTLGVGTWIVNYALPWTDAHPMLARYTIAVKGYWESLVVTGHQATGSLLIASSIALTLHVWRHPSTKF